MIMLELICMLRLMHILYFSKQHICNLAEFSFSKKNPIFNFIFLNLGGHKTLRKCKGDNISL